MPIYEVEVTTIITVEALDEEAVYNKVELMYPADQYLSIGDIEEVA